MRLPDLFPFSVLKVLRSLVKAFMRLEANEMTVNLYKLAFKKMSMAVQRLPRPSRSMYFGRTYP